MTNPANDLCRIDVVDGEFILFIPSDRREGLWHNVTIPGHKISSLMRILSDRNRLRKQGIPRTLGTPAMPTQRDIDAMTADFKAKEKAEAQAEAERIAKELDLDLSALEIAL